MNVKPDPLLSGREILCPPCLVTFEEHPPSAELDWESAFDRNIAAARFIAETLTSQARKNNA